MVPWGVQVDHRPSVVRNKWHDSGASDAQSEYNACVVPDLYDRKLSVAYRLLDKLLLNLLLLPNQTDTDEPNGK